MIYSKQWSHWPSVHIIEIVVLFYSGPQTRWRDGVGAITKEQKQNKVNALNFRTLFETFWPKVCFLCSCFLKYLVEWQAVRHRSDCSRPRSDCSFKSCLIWVCTVCIRQFFRNFGVETLGHLFVLRFYGPVNPMGSCRARSVYLTTRLLGRLSPLTS